MQVFNYQSLKKAFNSTAETYQSHDKIAPFTEKNLLERLQILKSSPQKILDLGSGKGQLTEQLHKLYPNAEIYNLDLAEQRLHLCQKSQQNFAICADAHHLPFSNTSFDLIISNLCLHWLNDPMQAIEEIHRILKPEGVLLFSVPGPDTLFELRQAFEKTSPHAHINLFYDMHDLGDAILKAGFSDPVMDVEYLNLEFEDLDQLFLMLKQTGQSNHLQNQFKGLTPKKLKKKIKDNYQKQGQHYNTTIEIIYAIAFRAEPKQQIKDNEISIPITQIKKAHNI